MYSGVQHVLQQSSNIGVPGWRDGDEGGAALAQSGEDGIKGLLRVEVDDGLRLSPPRLLGVEVSWRGPGEEEDATVRQLLQVRGGRGQHALPPHGVHHLLTVEVEPVHLGYTLGKKPIAWTLVDSHARVRVAMSTPIPGREAACHVPGEGDQPAGAFLCEWLLPVEVEREDFKGKHEVDVGFRAE